MKWSEVRKYYPDKFVKFKVLKYTTVDNKRFVDDVAMIEVINDGLEAMKEFAKCKEGEFIYNTKNEQVIIDVVKYTGIRSIISSNRHRH